MKTIYIFLTLVLSINALTAQVAFIIAPKATAYASKDKSGAKLGIYHQNTIFYYSAIDKEEGWLTLANTSQPTYLALDEVAIFDTKQHLGYIDIGAEKYNLSYARYTPDIEQPQNVVYTPCLLHSNLREIFVIHSPTPNFNLHPDISMEKTSDVLQYGQYELGGYTKNTSLTIQDNLLRISSSSYGYNQQTGEDESSEKTSYMAIKKDKNGSFWAIHQFAPNTDYADIKENLYVENLQNKACQLHVQVQNFNEQEMIRKTVVAQEEGTGKKYNIYLSPPKDQAHYFKKKYIEIENIVGDDSYVIPATYGKNLLLYFCYYDMEGEGVEQVYYYTYTLKMVNGQIQATENVAERKAWQFISE